MADAACPFCGERPDGFVAERALAFLIWDAFPVSPGHALVIPRRHIRSWFNATREELQECAELVGVARGLIGRNHSPDGYNIGMNDGVAAGQTVDHAHLHIIPRYNGDVPDPTGGVRGVIPAKANYLLHAEPSARGLIVREPGEHALVAGAPYDPLLPQLLDALDRAERVDIAAAFVLQGGVNLLREHLQDVLIRGGKVRILTGDYFSVTEPSALRTLLDLQHEIQVVTQEGPDSSAPGSGPAHRSRGSIEVRVYETVERSFHPKAYIVSTAESDGVAFVGSSNLTRTALREGIEWNYRVVHARDRQGFRDLVQGFANLWDDPRTAVADEAWIHEYEARRQIARSKEAGVDTTPEPPPEPHPIQANALEALEATRAAGNSAGLVVLATGLGKTWLSAFDTKRPEFKRVLFVAHREEILSQALKTFRRIRPDASLGYYAGGEWDPHAEVVFASIQTLSRVRHLHRFEAHTFDYIIVDEFHHAAARSYRRVINYFEPRFLLGLTATPQRTDGADLLALCGDNLVFRADLDSGLREDLLCPFDYYGVPDLVDYDTIPWRSRRFDPEELTRSVATQERAQNALEQLEKYGGGRTLAFCASQQHADFMAAFFDQAGLKAVAVHSGPTSAPRAHSLERLQAGQMDVVCAVDMFNEGVDLPDLNTVLMLRPTESRVLWLQQFGRGLRWREGKRLKVIDYIGNHRIFLTKTQALLGLGGAEREVAHALEKLEAGEWELPPGCTVTYELEAKQILKSLIPVGTAAEQLQDYYREFRDLHGARPLAIQAFNDGWNPRTTRRNGFGSWLEFVDLEGDLSETEAAVLEEHRHFFQQLDVTAMTKSYKMVVLLAMLGAGDLPGSIRIDQLVERFQSLARRYTVIRGEVGEALDDSVALRRLILDNPVNAWTQEGAMRGRTFFEFDGEVFSFLPTIPGEQHQAFADLTQELVEWRLMEYLHRNPVNAGTDYFVCRVSQSSGRPIIFLPTRETNSGIPQGWIDLVAEGRNLQAKFVKVALNVVTERGSNENILPELLRSWFGADAGQPGTMHRVVFQVQDGTYTMRPLSPEASLPDGPVRWERYSRAEAFGALRITAKGWDRQQGVVERPDQFAFFVTLDKSGKPESHKYEDEFVSSVEFQWQSQNRTTRDSDRGRRYQSQPESEVPIHLFVRAKAKQGSETLPFVYAGRLGFLRWEGDKPITIWWRLEEAVPERLWRELSVPVGKEPSGGPEIDTIE